MRVSFLLVLALLPVACSIGLEPPTAEILVSEGRAERSVPPEHAPRIERALRALLSSCSSNNSDWAGSAAAWHQKEGETSIQARYPAAIRVRTMRDEIEVDAILYAPLSPDHVFARRGAVVYAFAKWRPEAEAALTCDPTLDLTHHPRIRQLCDMMDRVQRSQP